jgi:hypothetical protein
VGNSGGIVEEACMYFFHNPACGLRVIVISATIADKYDV